jgi:hypothetical protein
MTYTYPGLKIHSTATTAATAAVAASFIGADSEATESNRRSFGSLRCATVAQDAGKLLARSGIGNELPELRPLQRAHVEEAQCRDVVLNRAGCQLAGLQQIGLKGAQMLKAKPVGRLAEETGKVLDPPQVVADRGVGVVTALEFLQHDLA